MDWRLSNGSVRCTATKCGDHPIPAGALYVKVLGGPFRCEGWVKAIRDQVDDRLAETHAELATVHAEDLERRGELETLIARLTRELEVLEPPTDLRVSVPVPQPTLPMDTHRGADMVTPNQLARSARYNHLREAGKLKGDR